MAIEDDVMTAVKGLVGNRMFFMTAPFNTKRPFITFQFVGGRPSNTLCGETDKQNSRIQFNVWDEVHGANGAQSMVLMRQLMAIVTEPPLRGVSQGSAQSVWDDATKTYGARIDVSFWR